MSTKTRHTVYEPSIPNGKRRRPIFRNISVIGVLPENFAYDEFLEGETSPEFYNRILGYQLGASLLSARTLGIGYPARYGLIIDVFADVSGFVVSPDALVQESNSLGLFQKNLVNFAGIQVEAIED